MHAPNGRTWIFKYVGYDPGEESDAVEDLHVVLVRAAGRLGRLRQLLHGLVAERGQVGRGLLSQGADLGRGNQREYILE